MATIPFTKGAGKPIPVSASVGTVNVSNVVGGPIYVMTFTAQGVGFACIKLMPGESGTINFPAGGTARYNAFGTATGVTA